MTGWVSEVLAPSRKKQAASFRSPMELRHGAGAEGSGQAGYGGGVAQAGGVVHVVGAQDGAGEFLDEVVFLVGGLGRGDDGDLFRLVPGEFGADVLQGFVPANLDERAVSFDQRRGQPVGVMDEFPDPVAAFDAKPAFR